MASTRWADGARSPEAPASRATAPRARGRVEQAAERLEHLGAHARVALGDGVDADAAWRPARRRAAAVRRRRRRGCAPGSPAARGPCRPGCAWWRAGRSPRWSRRRVRGRSPRMSSFMSRSLRFGLRRGRPPPAPGEQGTRQARRPPRPPGTGAGSSRCHGQALEHSPDRLERPHIARCAPSPGPCYGRGQAVGRSVGQSPPPRRAPRVAGVRQVAYRLRPRPPPSRRSRPTVAYGNSAISRARLTATATWRW
jgi:hypothetical protein